MENARIVVTGGPFYGLEGFVECVGDGGVMASLDDLTTSVWIHDAQFEVIG